MLILLRSEQIAVCALKDKSEAIPFEVRRLQKLGFEKEALSNEMDKTWMVQLVSFEEWADNGFDGKHYSRGSAKPDNLLKVNVVSLWLHYKKHI